MTNFPIRRRRTVQQILLRRACLTKGVSKSHDAVEFSGRNQNGEGCFVVLPLGSAPERPPPSRKLGKLRRVSAASTSGISGERRIAGHMTNCGNLKKVSSSCKRVKTNEDNRNLCRQQSRGSTRSRNSSCTYPSAWPGAVSREDSRSIIPPIKKKVRRLFLNSADVSGSQTQNPTHSNSRNHSSGGRCSRGNGSNHSCGATQGKPLYGGKEVRHALYPSKSISEISNCSRYKLNSPGVYYSNYSGYITSESEYELIPESNSNSQYRSVAFLKKINKISKPPCRYMRPGECSFGRMEMREYSVRDEEEDISLSVCNSCELHEIKSRTRLCPHNYCSNKTRRGCRTEEETHLYPHNYCSNKTRRGCRTEEEAHLCPHNYCSNKTRTGCTTEEQAHLCPCNYCSNKTRRGCTTDEDRVCLNYRRSPEECMRVLSNDWSESDLCCSAKTLDISYPKKTRCVDYECKSGHGTGRTRGYNLHNNWISRAKRLGPVHSLAFNRSGCWKRGKFAMKNKCRPSEAIDKRKCTEAITQTSKILMTQINNQNAANCSHEEKRYCASLPSRNQTMNASSHSFTEVKCIKDECSELEFNAPLKPALRVVKSNLKLQSDHEQFNVVHTKSQESIEMTPSCAQCHHNFSIVAPSCRPCQQRWPHGRHHHNSCLNSYETLSDRDSIDYRHEKLKLPKRTTRKRSSRKLSPTRRPRNRSSSQRRCRKTLDELNTWNRPVCCERRTQSCDNCHYKRSNQRQNKCDAAKILGILQKTVAGLEHEIKKRNVYESGRSSPWKHDLSPTSSAFMKRSSRSRRPCHRLHSLSAPCQHEYANFSNRFQQGIFPSGPSYRQGSPASRPFRQQGFPPSIPRYQQGSSASYPSRQQEVPPLSPPDQQGSSASHPSSQQELPPSSPLVQKGSSASRPTSQHGSSALRPSGQQEWPPSSPPDKHGSSASHPSSQQGLPPSSPAGQQGLSASRPSSQHGSSASRPFGQQELPPLSPSDKHGSTASRPSSQHGSSVSRPSGQQGLPPLSPHDQHGSSASRPSGQQGLPPSSPHDQEGSSGARPSGQKGSSISSSFWQQGSIYSNPPSQQESFPSDRPFKQGVSSSYPHQKFNQSYYPFSSRFSQPYNGSLVFDRPIFPYSAYYPYRNGMNANNMFNWNQSNHGNVDMSYRNLQVAKGFSRIDHNNERKGQLYPYNYSTPGKSYRSIMDRVGNYLFPHTDWYGNNLRVCPRNPLARSQMAETQYENYSMDTPQFGNQDPVNRGRVTFQDHASFRPHSAESYPIENGYRNSSPPCFFEERESCLANRNHKPSSQQKGDNLRKEVYYLHTETQECRKSCVNPNSPNSCPRKRNKIEIKDCESPSFPSSPRNRIELDFEVCGNPNCPHRFAENRNEMEDCENPNCPHRLRSSPNNLMLCENGQCIGKLKISSAVPYIKICEQPQDRYEELSPTECYENPTYPVNKKNMWQSGGLESFQSNNNVETEQHNAKYKNEENRCKEVASDLSHEDYSIRNRVIFTNINSNDKNVLNNLKKHKIEKFKTWEPVQVGPVVRRPKNQTPPRTYISSHSKKTNKGYSKGNSQSQSYEYDSYTSSSSASSCSKKSPTEGTKPNQMMIRHQSETKCQDNQRSTQSLSSEWERPRCKNSKITEYERRKNYERTPSKSEKPSIPKKTDNYSKSPNKSKKEQRINDEKTPSKSSGFSCFKKKEESENYGQENRRRNVKQENVPPIEKTISKSSGLPCLRNKVKPPPLKSEESYSIIKTRRKVQKENDLRNQKTELKTSGLLCFKKKEKEGSFHSVSYGKKERYRNVEEANDSESLITNTKLSGLVNCSKMKEKPPSKRHRNVEGENDSQSQKTQTKLVKLVDCLKRKEKLPTPESGANYSKQVRRKYAGKENVSPAKEGEKKPSWLKFQCSHHSEKKKERHLIPEWEEIPEKLAKSKKRSKSPEYFICPTKLKTQKDQNNKQPYKQIEECPGREDQSTQDKKEVKVLYDSSFRFNQKSCSCFEIIEDLYGYNNPRASARSENKYRQGDCANEFYKIVQ